MAAAGLYVALAVAALTFFFWRVIYGRWKIIKMMHYLPGPFAVPILGTSWQFKWKMSELTKQWQGWGEYYAGQGHSLVKLWLGPRPMIIVIRPEAAKVVLESNTLITKGNDYDILLPWLGTGLLTSTGAKWQSRRKMLTPSFHFKMLNDFLIAHDYQSKIFVELIDKFAETGEQFDIFPWIKRCALDIICETAMGCTVSAQTNHNHPYVISVQQMNEIAFKYMRMPWLQLKPIWWLSGVGAEYDSHLRVLTDFTRKVILDKIEEAKEGQADEGKKKAFLDMLVELSRDGSLSYEDIREEVDTFMFEGHDTTSASMGWTLWCLAHNPECQRKIQEELDMVFGDTDRDMTNEDLKQLKYLERCIKEGLRMRPSVPNFTRRVEEDVEIDGMLIPTGCSIMIAPMMIHRNPLVHENPLKFDPDRFLEENISKRHPYSYIPFSAGPRNCIGQKFAMMEEKTMLGWFFRKFSISSSVPHDNNIPMPEIILRPSIGFPVKIQRR